MNDPMTPSALRKDLYNVLDEVLETGRPRPIRRRGQVVWLVAELPARSFRIGDGPALPDAYVGTFDELVDTGWDGAWSPDDSAAV